jgi:hypothetical protein
VSATIQFRAVFIEVENSAELREFRERLRDIISALPLIPPHISPSLICDSWRSGLP